MQIKWPFTAVEVLKMHTPKSSHAYVERYDDSNELSRISYNRMGTRPRDCAQLAALNASKASAIPGGHK